MGNKQNIRKLSRRNQERLDRLVEHFGSLRKAGDYLLLGAGTLSMLASRGAGNSVHTRVEAGLDRFEEELLSKAKELTKGINPVRERKEEPRRRTIADILRFAEGAGGDGERLDRIEAKLDAMLAKLDLFMELWGV